MSHTALDGTTTDQPPISANRFAAWPGALNLLAHPTRATLEPCPAAFIDVFRQPAHNTLRVIENRSRW